MKTWPRISGVAMAASERWRIHEANATPGEPDQEAGEDVERVAGGQKHEVELLAGVELALIRQLHRLLNIDKPIMNSHLTSSSRQRQAVRTLRKCRAKSRRCRSTVQSGSRKRHTPDRRCVQEKSAPKRPGRVRIVDRDQHQRRDVADHERHGDRPVQLALGSPEPQDLVWKWSPGVRSGRRFVGKHRQFSPRWGCRAGLLVPSPLDARDDPAWRQPMQRAQTCPFLTAPGGRWAGPQTTMVRCLQKRNKPGPRQLR